MVEEDVAFGPENLGIPTPEIQARVSAALKAVGMEEFTLHAPHHLSGGQKQRIAIAGVIAMEPACIVLDESTAMLDPLGRREVMDGTPQEILVQVEKLQAIGLAAPHTVELLHGLRQDGFDVPLDALGIQECADVITASFKS